jgi:PAS domain S-box-containing protein
VQAELARVNDDVQAIHLYEQAIDGARYNLYRQEEALSLERQALFNLSHGGRRAARGMLSQAYSLYQEWGAVSKCDQMRERYPELVAESRRSTTGSTSSGAHDLDQISIARAAQTISTEIEHEKLIETLVSIAVENAGADRAILAIADGDQFFIEAYRDVPAGVFITSQHELFDDRVDIPGSILSSVLESSETVVIRDAVRDERFWNDDYVRKNATRSILAVPLVHRKRVIGALCLENRHLEDVFSNKARETVQILATQAAISITNADLLSTVRQSEERFHLAMEASNDGLWDWDLRCDEIYLSPGWRRMLGYEENELDGNPKIWESLASPEDVEKLYEMFESVLGGISNRFELEIRLQHNDGHWIDVLTRARVVHDQTGAAIRMVGTQQDITERKVAERRIRRDLHERDVLLRELYHRTKNNMQVIVSLMRIKEHKSEDPFVRELVGEVAAKIDSMALVHQMLYESQNLSEIDLGEYLVEFAANVLGGSDARSYSIRLVHEVQYCPISIDGAIPLGMVVSELITNSIKHAFGTGSAEPDNTNQIYISVEKTEDGARVVLADNGGGLTDDLDLRMVDSMGMQTVFALIEQQLSGKIRYDNESGLRWEIVLPLLQKHDRLATGAEEGDKV